MVTNAYPSQVKPYAGVFVAAQVSRLRERDVDVDVLFIRRSFTGPVGSVGKYLGAALRSLPRMFRRYDAVHVHFLSPLLAVGWLYKVLHPKTRFLLTVHGSAVRRLAPRGMLARCYRVVTQRVDTVQAVGRELASDFELLMSRKVDIVLPAGVDKRIFRPSSGGGKRFDFVFVGSLTEAKGVDLLIQAARRAGEYSLCIVGSGPLEADLREVGNVVFCKDLTQKEVAQKLNQSRFLVFPTRMDAFGLVVTEALYCGVPVIASRIDGVLDQIEEDVTGLFINQLSVDALTTAMDAAMAMSEQQYQSMSSAAMSSNATFSLDAVCDVLIAEYLGAR